MRSKLRVSRRVALLAVGALLFAGMASAQKNRIRTYQRALETKIEKTLEEFRVSLVKDELPDERTIPVERQRARPRDTARVIREESSSRHGLQKPFQNVVHVEDSADGDGQEQDVEIRLTMPIDAFMEYAPVAALEAAATPHKFPVVYIYLREETTDRVARVAFADAEPIAGRYLAGDEEAVEEMKDALIWH